MKTFTKQELDKILDNHKLWISSGGDKGERANLSYADLRYANLSYANLSYADLRSADLSYANLSSANLRCADLSYASLDYSAFPLWCGGLNVNIDDRIAIQLLYHFVRNVKTSPHTSEGLKSLCRLKSVIKWANKFHRAEECGKIEED